jgi:hypothetical protein
MRASGNVPSSRPVDFIGAYVYCVYALPIDVCFVFLALDALKTITMTRRSLSLFILAVWMVACGDQASNEEVKSEEPNPVEAVMDSSDLRRDVSEETPQPTPDSAAKPQEPAEVAEMRKKFPAGGFEWKVLDFIASDEPEVVVVLDKVPLEGEELSVDAEEQLNNLVSIHTAFPFLLIDVQAHTTEANNGVARQAKKATSKARAVWVATKLNLKGIPGDKLSSSGMADEQLLDAYEGDDKRQKRIMAKITRGKQF